MTSEDIVEKVKATLLTSDKPEKQVLGRLLATDIYKHFHQWLIDENERPETNYSVNAIGQAVTKLLVMLGVDFIDTMAKAGLEQAAADQLVRVFKTGVDEFAKLKSKPSLVRGILIDPEAKTITEVEHDPRKFTQIYELLTTSLHKVETFDIVQLTPANALYVDDDGLSKTPQVFFRVEGYPQPLAGRGLILGVDPEGNTVGATLPLDVVKARVTFYDTQPEVLGFEEREEEIDHPVFGPMKVVRRETKFKEPN